MKNFSIGDTVAWNWAGSIAHGEVKEIKTERTHIESNGKIITRNGTKDNPAVIISHRSGHDVLKLANELQRAD